MTDLDIQIVDHKYPVLGRNKVHDPLSKGFPMGATINRDSWVTKLNRIYDPPTNPNQCHGECTGCSNAMMLNSAGNRVVGQILGMDYAHKVYTGASLIDPFDGSWPPTDTGSSGLAAAKTAQKLGKGAGYRWLFGGADEVIQTVMSGRVVSVGTWWHEGMMRRDDKLRIFPTGPRVGGHQYVVRGYDKPMDAAVIRCWWGTYRDAYLSRTVLDELLRDGGDAHVQDRKMI
jgi:hypothetical protein